MTTPTLEKSNSSSLWVESLRPKSISTMLLPREHKKFFDAIIENAKTNGQPPNLLLHSSLPGAGKTSCVLALANDLDVEYKFINASADGGIATLRDDIRTFAMSASLFGQEKQKVVILDEADGMSPNLQSALRSAIEEYSNNCRFWLTCNYKHKIIPALQSRLQDFDFNMSTSAIRSEMLPKVVSRCEMVLKKNNVTYDKNVLETLVDQRYPDIRKIYNILQQYSIQNGHIGETILSFQSIDKEVLKLVLDRDITKTMKCVNENGYDIEGMFQFFFDELVPIVEPEAKIAIISICRSGLRDLALGVNPKIVFMDCLVEICGVV